MLEDTGHRHYSRAVCMLFNIFDPPVPCKYSCKWVAPFGYVHKRKLPVARLNARRAS